VNYVKTISTTLAVCMMAALVACSSGSSSSTGGGGGGTTPISVALTGAQSSLSPNATDAITATVSNDSAAKGVTWSCTPASSCGSFNPTATASGTATTYTAPGAAGSVTVTATSVSDTTKTATATISITVPQIALADGNYVFFLNGTDVPGITNAGGFGGLTYDVAGVITVAGGIVTAGEQDFVDSNSGGDLHDAINPTGSSYTTSADGHLQITLTTCTGQTCATPDPSVGVAGVETIVGTPISSTCATSGGPCVTRIAEFDTFATSSGTLELQSSTASPSGPYTFGVNGLPSQQVSAAGIMNFSAATVSTTGTVFDLVTGPTAIYSNQTISAGTLGTPDSLGRTQISLTPTSGSTPLISFAAYVVDTSHMVLVEAASPLGGIAYAQNTSALAVAESTYVISMIGQDGAGALTVAGALNLASSGSVVSGTISYNDLFFNIVSGAAVSGGTWVASTSGVAGDYTLTGVTDGNVTFNIELYVDGNGHASVVTQDLGVDATGGVGYLQSGGASFSGNYVLSATGYDGTNEFELDAVGPVATGTNTFSGSVDLNWLSAGTAAVPQTSLSVSGAFTTPNAGGIAIGTGNTITGLDVTTATNADAFDYYVVDSTKVIAIETDTNGNQLTLGAFDLVQ